MQTELEVLSPVDDLDDADNSRRAVGSDTLSKGLTDDKVALENFRYSCSLHSRSPSHLTKWTDQRERGKILKSVHFNYRPTWIFKHKFRIHIFFIDGMSMNYTILNVHLIMTSPIIGESLTMTLKEPVTGL